MKKRIVILLLMAVLLLATACGTATGTDDTDKKKPLPGNEAEVDSSKVHYKETMLPFEELISSDRIVVLQNAVNYSRDGFYTEATKPSRDDANGGFAITYVTDFLNNGVKGDVTFVNLDGEKTKVDKDDFLGMYVILDDFQNPESPVLRNSETGTELSNMDYILTDSKEAIVSVIPEQNYNVKEVIEKAKWDNTLTYRLVATDKFYIPITPEDYDAGEIRGTISGAVNASFPDMTIANGKINDVIYVEKIVE